jgi:hypothetical protein
MNYTSLEDAYGTPFQQRVPIVHSTSNEPIAKPEFSSIADKSKQSVEKNKDLIQSLTGSLPLDKNPETQNIKVPEPKVKEPSPVEFRHAIRESFAEQMPTTYDEKLSRILRLIEQNKTGYERPATEDMLLYIFTGIMFLFTFDTFVTLGRTLRQK